LIAGLKISNILELMGVESKIPNDYPMKPAQTINSWYAVRVRSRFERAVSAALSGKGYDQYLPLYHSRRRWSDRSKDLDLPLFPGYLFCRFDVQVRLPILMTPGVISIVGIGKTPVAISDREVDAIQTVIRSGLYLQPWPQLAVGSRVVIEEGPLKGLEGVTLDIKKKYNLIVSVPLLQRSVAVEIDREWVRPLTMGMASRDASSARGLSSVAKVA
jgi:transcription antitermination factor NusG